LREDLTPREEEIIKKFDLLLFKGYKHVKRQDGITILDRCISHVKYDFVKYFQNLFIDHFSCNQASQISHS
jgi:hypothetical protein